MADRDGFLHEGERGAALLTVLLLVAVMAVVTAAALERLTLATRLAANVSAADQARAYADSASLLVEQRLGDLVAAQPGKVTLEGDWLGRAQPLAVPGGSATVTPYDGGNCFNLNSLVAGQDAEHLTQRPVALSQFVALMQYLGVPSAKASAISAAAADWIDSDGVPLPGGAEDETYLSRKPAYRAANRTMQDASELRAVAGMTPALYNLLAPWICALPTTDLSPINVNTLLPAQAPLFAMLVPGKLSVEMARAMLAARPANGYDSTVAFWAAPALRGLTPPAEVAQQVRLTTRWFRAETSVVLGGTEIRQVALYDAQARPVRQVRRFDGGGA
ncbi:MAG: type II secretion system minor pseudopilin GspK [Sphingobium sp.]